MKKRRNETVQSLGVYRQRQMALRLWDGLILGLLVMLIPALLSGLHILPGPPAAFAAAALAAGVVLRLLLPEEPLIRAIENRIGTAGEVQTLADCGEKDTPYHALLKERVEGILKIHPPAGVFPLRPVRRLGLSLLLLILGALLTFVPDRIHPPEPAPAAVLEELARRLAEEAEIEPGYSPLSQRMDQAAEELEENPEGEGWKEVEELSRELTEQIRELERNALSQQFEERGVTRSEKLDRLSRGELSPEETREFVLDLLSDPNLSEESKAAVQRAYRDYSQSDPAENRSGRSEDLADDLRENLADSEEARESRRILRELDDLLAQNDGKEKQPPPGEPEERPPGAEERESRRFGEGGGEGPAEEGVEGRRTTAAGSSEDEGGEERDFIPFQGEAPSAELPEGEVLERGDQGVLRLPGEDKLHLDRSYSADPGGAVTETLIDPPRIPEGSEDIIKDYFTAIGSGD